MVIPRRLLEPLTINTNIIYDLSKFPDDVKVHNGPLLMIAPVSVKSDLHNRHIRSGTQTRTMGTNSWPCVLQKTHTTSAITEDVDLADIPMEDLIKGSTWNSQYTALLEDVLSGVPDFQELQYMEGPMPVLSQVSRTPQTARRPQMAMFTQRHVQPQRSLGNYSMIPTCVTKTQTSDCKRIYSKRKRSCDTDEDLVQKRQCLSTGYARHYNTYHSLPIHHIRVV